ncbi:MAG TPA: ferritin-like protein [Egibacteraceae bacterium]|nr:ferritin-like protein [Egibacteraceae bacterium]
MSRTGPRMVIEHRDALIYMLSEAAELEHAIMCQYLFAAFSLKTDPDEGLDERRLATVADWKQQILRVAHEEMLHMALVNNLLAAVGAAPRVGRPNLPQAGRYYPPGVHLALEPFSERALRHFLFLERPEGINRDDVEAYQALQEAEPLRAAPEDIVPSGQHFATVGELYRAIGEGMEHLAERHGEQWLFCGPPYAQAGPDSFQWADLVPVTDLASARQAIDTVVEQGEGTRGHWRDAHYGRFLHILGEFLELRRADPSFEPARPVIAACVRAPVDAPPSPLVGDPVTARVLDAFNVSYEILLYTLGRFFGHGHETPAQLQALAGVAVGLMVQVLKPLGEAATRMPAGPDHPGRTAGPSFEVFYRAGYMLPHTDAAWVLLHERLVEVAGYLGAVVAEQQHLQRLLPVVDALHRFAGVMAAQKPELAQRSVRFPAAWGVGAVRSDP